MSATANNPMVGADATAESPRTTSLPKSNGQESISWSPARSALQALLAFSSLHEQLRQRRAQQAGKRIEVEDSELEQFALDEVLQLVAHRALAITEADGVAIALAEGNAIVCRASAGFVSPDAGMRIDLDSGFSGACLRGGQIVRCDNSETDFRVNAQACRQLGARSMVAVPLSARQNVIGLIEAFSTEVAGFTDGNVRSLNLLAELILSALKPEEEDRLAEIARRVVQHSSPAELGPIPVIAVLSTIKPADSGRGVSSTDSKDALRDGKSVSEPEVKATPVEIEEPISALNPLANVEVPKEEPPKQIKESFEESAVTKEIASPVSPLTEPAKSTPGLWLVLALILVAATLGFVVWQKLPHHVSDTVVNRAVEAQASTPTTSAGSATPGSSEGSASQQPGSSSTPQEPDAPSATSPDKSNSQPRVTGIRHWSSTDSSTVVIDLQDQVQYEAHRLASPERVYLDLRDTKLPHELDGKIIDVDDSLLFRVRIAQPTRGVTRVVLETKTQSSYSVSLEQSPFRLVVQIRKSGSGAKEPTPADLSGQHDMPPATPTTPEPSSTTSPATTITNPVTTSQSSPATNVPTRVAAITPVSAGVKDLRISPLGRSPLNSKITDPLDAMPAHVAAPKLRIVLDAGHGGWDLGTVGRKGLLEKDLVLDIVERLGALVQRRLSAEIIYTRQDDSYIALEKRAEIANVSRADLFVSVHANYSDSASARGVETYYTNTYSSVRARTADADSAEIKLQNIDWTHVDIRAKVEQSHRFAASIQHSLYGALASTNPDIRNRGVKEAAYVVLTGTSMPAVLAEVSFVSSPMDENNLQSSRYRQQIAEALYKGIAKYTESARHVQMASSSPKPASR
jgi:N-acetylmuramoyl-L-alanine amidase